MLLESLVEEPKSESGEEFRLSKLFLAIFLMEVVKESLGLSLVVVLKAWENSL